jgi:hypothetical protein
VLAAASFLAGSAISVLAVRDYIEGVPARFPTRNVDHG